MRRRDFIAGIAGSATAWPFVTRAQQGGGMRRIGVLMINPESDSEGQAWVRAFREGLEKLGWAEGRSIRFDLRWSAPGDVEAHRRLAAELVALQPDLILSQGTPSTTALLRQTRTIPVIFGITADPVGDGFVASFPRPGGNATGFIVTEPTIAAKWVELLKEIVPGVTKVAILFNPTTATYADYWLKPFKAAAASFALKAIEAHIRNKSDMEPIVAAEARETNSSMIVMPDPFTQTHRAEITSLAARFRLPLIGPNRAWAELGGLLAYGADLTDNFRRAAVYNPQRSQAGRASRPGSGQVRAGD